MNDLDQLRTEMAAMRAQLGALTQEVIRGGRSKRDGLSGADAAHLLSPRSLSRPIGLRPATAEAAPDLGSPLLSRLRDDAALGSLAAGSPDYGYPNLLNDPLFATMEYLGSSLTTSYVARGTEWEAKYVLNSGTAPATRDLEPGVSRGSSGSAYGFEHSSLASLDLSFASAGSITVYLRPIADHLPFAEFLPSWITASGWFVVQTSGTNLTATAKVQIIDDIDTVLAESDEVDLVTLGDIAEATPAYAAYEGPVALDPYRVRFVITVEATAAAGTIIGIGNPLLAYSDDGSPPPFTPAVGFFYTPGGATADTTSVVATRVRRTTNQSISDATDTVVNWETAAYDDPGMYDSGTPGRLTVTEDGKYHLSAGVTFAASSGGQQRSIWFIRNGSTGTIYAKARITSPSGAVQNHLHASIDMDLAAGDYVTVYCHQDSGGALNVIGADHNTFFAIHKIGGAQGATGATGATGTVSTGTVVTATLSADQNDWNPTGLSGAGTLRIDPSGGSWTVTGLAAQADGTVLFVENVDASANVYIAHDSASSAAANRVLCYDAVDGRLPAGASAWLRYDGTSQRWYLTGQAWNPGEDSNISDLAFGDVADANQTLSGSEFAPAAHVHGMPANPVVPGVIVPYVSETAPTGFLLCNGQAVSRTTYADLFAVCGTTFGVGDGSTTFNVPDLRGRFLYGRPTGGGAPAIGTTGGSFDHTHSYSQVLNHTHAVTITDPGHRHGMAEGTTDGAGNFADRSNAAAASAMQTDSATTGITASTDNPAGGVASGTTGSNNPPYMVLAYIIKT